MRRADKEIHDLAAMEDILRKATVCRLAMSNADRPYVVPLCFGYQDRVLYFHCASEGMKLDILRKNDRVCFEVDVDHEFVKAEDACSWGLKYRSVVGFGRAAIVDDAATTLAALDVIMRHYADGPFRYTPDAIGKTTIIKVDIERMSGKASGY